jgi:hypothetical protein
MNNEINELRKLAGIPLTESQSVNEAREPRYLSIFTRGDDGRWSHYFDADSKEDAASEVHSLKNQGVKTLVIPVPVSQADWRHVNPHQFVMDYLNKKAKPVAEDFENGYDITHQVDQDDIFPDGADSPLTDKVGPSGSKQGDNPEQKSAKVSMNEETKQIHKDLVYKYRSFLKD